MQSDTAAGYGHVVALVLAGGESRRMGGPKALLRLPHAGTHGSGAEGAPEPETLLERAVRVSARVADRVIVVVGAYADRYAPVAERVGADVIPNLDWSRGMASSLHAAARAVRPDEDGLLVVLPDQPFVSSAHLATLLGLGRSSGATAVFSRYGSAPGAPLGAPALLHRSLIPRLLELRGDRGAKALLPYVDRVESVPLERHDDVDTPEDARALGLESSG